MCINVKHFTQTLHFWLNAHKKRKQNLECLGRVKNKKQVNRRICGGLGGGGQAGLFTETHTSNKKHKAKGSVSKSPLFQTVQKLQQRLPGAQISLVLLVPQHHLQLLLLAKFHNSLSLSTPLSPERPRWAWFRGRLSSPSCCCVRMERGPCWAWFHGRLSSCSCCRVRMERGTSWQGGGWCGRCHDAESTATFALHQSVCWGIVHQPVSKFRLKCRNKTLTCKHN